MRVFKHVPAVVLAILLAACLFWYFSTRGSATPAASRNASAADPLVDTSLLQTAVDMAALAATPEEQAQAREAWRLADHELDLRFAAAVRDAEAAAAAQPAAALRPLSDKVAQLQALLEADKK